MCFSKVRGWRFVCVWAKYEFVKVDMFVCYSLTVVTMHSNKQNNNRHNKYYLSLPWRKSELFIMF